MARQSGDQHWTRRRLKAGLPAGNLNKAKKKALPVPVKIDSRICFAISYFTSEADADVYAAHVRAKGITYNGGWYDGIACGREKTWDYVDEKLGQLYAVTD